MKLLFHYRAGLFFWLLGLAYVYYDFNTHKDGQVLGVSIFLALLTGVSSKNGEEVLSYSLFFLLGNIAGLLYFVVHTTLFEGGELLPLICQVIILTSIAIAPWLIATPLSFFIGSCFRNKFIKK